MQGAPKGFRLHIGIFGRRNVGKSSLLNAMTRQEASIVSDVAGTTTDPVEKPMELLPVGPVLFIDTAGIDDAGALGQMRVARTRQVFDRTDLALLVVAAGDWGEFEEGILREFHSRKAPLVVVFNKSDLAAPPGELLERLKAQKTPWVLTVANRPSPAVQSGTGILPVSSMAVPAMRNLVPDKSHGQDARGTHGRDAHAALSDGVLDLREALIKAAPEDFINAPTILGDLVAAGELVMLVVPIDLEAPKGRLILPQVQALRDVLDVDAYAMVVKERELRDALDRLNRPPALVVTDSQGFLKVAGDTPPEVPLTSFSILFARYKGDLCEFVRGALAIDGLREGDRVLIAEACSHHPIGEDIGRVKIPRWLQQYTGARLEFTSTQGHDFPEDLSPYRLVVHCGACMWNRREMLSRMLRCRQAGVPIANYGMTIVYTLGIFERALGPFPAALETFRELRGGQPSPHDASRPE